MLHDLIFLLQPDEQSDDFCRVTKSWFEQIVTSTRNLHELCTQPFIEVVMPALQLLLVVSQQSWGRQFIVDTPGLLEWLLDREAACGVHKSTGSGASPECLRAKFDVAKVLNASPELGIAPELKNNLAEFVQQGPFYKRGLYEVATEAPGN
jgi:Proteasome non-ATPase 26S subunit